MDKSSKSKKPEVKTPDSLRAGAGQAASRLLRSATALRVTPPQRCGSRHWYGRKIPLGPASPAQPPLSPRKQLSPSDRPGAVQGAKRRSGPLTARTELESSGARGKGDPQTASQ